MKLIAALVLMVSACASQHAFEQSKASYLGCLDRNIDELKLAAAIAQNIHTLRMIEVECEHIRATETRIGVADASKTAAGCRASTGDRQASEAQLRSVEAAAIQTRTTCQAWRRYVGEQMEAREREIAIATALQGVGGAYKDMAAIQATPSSRVACDGRQSPGGSIHMDCR